MPAKKVRASALLVTSSQNIPKEEGTATTTEVTFKECGNHEQSENGYACVGNFQEDFTRLCKLKEMAVVPPVVSLTDPHSVAEIRTHDREKRVERHQRLNKRLALKAKSSLNRLPSVRMCDSCAVSEAFIQNSLIFKDKDPRIWPGVQVEMLDPNDFCTVTDIIVRGWKVDVSMMDTFHQCCLALQHLRALCFWNVGLTPETLEMLVEFLPQCRQLTSLNLDANPLGDSNVSLLLGADSLLEDLSLRFCELNDTTTYGIGTALGTTRRWNKTLTSLNMSNNKIGDVGAIHIANGLKTNRTLLVLNLASNKIGDTGAAALATALSRFALDQEQLVERRMREASRAKLPELAIPQRRSRALSMASSIDYSNRRRGERLSGNPSSTSTSSQSEKKKRGKDREDKSVGVKPLRRSVLKHSDSTQGSPKRTESPCSLVDKKGRRRSISGLAVPEVQVVDIHPLEEEGRLHEGQLWVVGNRRLVSLNLSRNQIGETGLRQLLEMVKIQGMLHSAQYCTQSGLMRLVVERNALATDNEVMKLISHYMEMHDPMHKTPLLTLNKTHVAPCAIPRIPV